MVYLLYSAIPCHSKVCAAHVKCQGLYIALILHGQGFEVLELTQVP